MVEQQRDVMPGVRLVVGNDTRFWLHDRDAAGGHFAALYAAMRGRYRDYVTDCHAFGITWRSLHDDCSEQEGADRNDAGYCRRTPCGGHRHGGTQAGRRAIDGSFR